MKDLINLSTTLHEMQRYAERQFNLPGRTNLDSCELSSYTLKQVNEKLDRLIAKYVVQSAYVLPPAIRQICRWQAIREKTLQLNPEMV